MEPSYNPVHNWNWKGRIDDSTDRKAFRIHQVVEQISIAQLISKPSGITLLGYACDEGVRRNKGRVGSSDGPLEIRKALSSMALHSNTPIYDLGDCICQKDQMEATQEMFAKSIAVGLSYNQLMIGLGGGHDIAYAHASGIFDYLNKNKKLGIINLDAHFDLRALKDLGNSGTPFYQLAQEHPDNFNYLAIGIQEYSNTQRLFSIAAELGSQHILRDQLQHNLYESLDQIRLFIDQVDHIYLTIDLDGLDSNICPGVSAPCVNGMGLHEILRIIDLILDSNKLLSLDIAELNPVFDIDHRTAKVAGVLVHRVISYQH